MSNYIQDEISLYDLWNVIVKHKKLFYFVFAIIFIAGFLVALLKAPVYQYSQAIKLAGYYDDGRNVALQDNKSMAMKISALYLPSVLRKYKAINDNNFSANDIGDDVVQLSVKGTEKNKAAYTGIFASILKQVEGEERSSLRIIKNSFNNQLTLLNKELASQDIFNKTLVEKRKSDLRDIIIAQQQDNYANLAANVAHVQRNLESLQDSHFISNMMRSKKPVGIAKHVLLVLFIMLAFMAAFFAVFVVEFFAKVKEQRLQVSNPLAES